MSLADIRIEKFCLVYCGDLCNCRYSGRPEISDAPPSFDIGGTEVKPDHQPEKLSDAFRDR